MNEPFLRKMLVSFISSNIPLYIEENPLEKLFKVLDIELKRYTPVVQNLFLIKSNLNL